MDKKKIVIIRSTSVNPDPRIEREATFLKGEYGIKVLAWNRENTCASFEQRNGYTIHRLLLKGRYGGGWLHIHKVLVWWIVEFVWLMRNSFDAVHACDFDTYPPALLAAKLKRKKIVYDIFDFYADMILHVPKPLKLLIKKTDLFLIRFADALIIADETRKRQITGSNPKRMITLYNTPIDPHKKYISSDRIEEKPFVLGYIGLLNKERGVEQVMEVVGRSKNVRLVIGGYGTYEDYIRQQAEKKENVEFLGRVVSYTETLKILSACDAMFALYDPTIPNHRFSSPNKLFEAMMFGKPIIVSRHTSMDKVVEQYSCGIVVEYGNLSELQRAIRLLEKMKREGDNFYGKNGRDAYENVFHPTITQKKLCCLYDEILRDA